MQNQRSKETVLDDNINDLDPELAQIAQNLSESQTRQSKKFAPKDLTNYYKKLGSSIPVEPLEVKLLLAVIDHKEASNMFSLWEAEQIVSAVSFLMFVLSIALFLATAENNNLEIVHTILKVFPIPLFCIAFVSFFHAGTSSNDNYTKYQELLKSSDATIEAYARMKGITDYNNYRSDRFAELISENLSPGVKRRLVRQRQEQRKKKAVMGTAAEREKRIREISSEMKDLED